MQWSNDGRYLLYASDANARSTASRLWLLRMGGTDAPRPLDGTAPAGPRGAQGRLSPNGRWLAYEADGSGKREILVRPFPEGARTWQVSTNGGIEPQWSADGKELFFLAFDRKLMSVPVTTEGDFRPGVPGALFQTALDAYGIPISGHNQYVVSPDGQRFLLRQARTDAPPPAITVVMNWRALVK
jgi:serine/threonine-protein kinase